MNITYKYPIAWRLTCIWITTMMTLWYWTADTQWLPLTILTTGIDIACVVYVFLHWYLSPGKVFKRRKKIALKAEKEIYGWKANGAPIPTEEIERWQEVNAHKGTSTPTVDKIQEN